MEILITIAMLMTFTANFPQLKKSLEEKQITAYNFPVIFMFMTVNFIWAKYAYDMQIDGVLYQSLFLSMIFTIFFTFKVLFEKIKFEVLFKYLTIIAFILCIVFFIPTEYSILIANTVGSIAALNFLYVNFKANSFHFLSLLTIIQLEILFISLFLYGLLSNDYNMMFIHLFNSLINAIMLVLVYKHSKKIS